MQIAKFIHNSIFEITKDELDGLLEKKELGLNFKCEEKQLFIYIKTEKKNYIAQADHNPDEIEVKTVKETTYIAIDNTSGEMFMEDFKIEDDAYCWLLDLKCSEVLQKVEEQDWWW